MRKIILAFIGINLLCVVTLASLYYLSETYPFHPGDPLYGLQYTAEQSRLSLSERGDKRASMAFTLAERRLANLAQADNNKGLEVAAIAFDEALSALISQGDQLTAIQQELFAEQFIVLLRQAEMVVFAIDDGACEQVSELQGRVKELLAANNPGDQEDRPVNNTVAIAPLEVEAMMISFLGQDVNHDIYPLEGAHKTTDCLNCHIGGQYAETLTECADCHTYQPVIVQNSKVLRVSFFQEDESDPTLMYPYHFEGACEECHDAVSWNPIAFDHEGILECYTCHQDDTPNTTQASYLAHRAYPSQCMDCHENTEDWMEIAFEHEEGLDCQSCHSIDTPDNHYLGECQNCHIDTADWEVVLFYHVGYPDCKSCHRPPENHYGDACTQCHYSTQTWLFATFDHTGFKDCKACHTAEKGHFSGQCSQCHNTRAWSDARFSHNGYSVTDCANCHLKDAPANHYCEDCCRCHNIKSWSQINFDHTNYPDCIDCHADEEPADHYGDLCSSCHNTDKWSNYSFDHSGYPDCYACHTAPPAHYSGQCSKCHTTTSWFQNIFDHSGSDNCTGCHAAPAGHWPGQCSNCHISTINWYTVRFDHDYGYKDCKSCHWDDRPGPPHPSRGQCSKCHTTSTWVIGTPVPATGSTPQPYVPLIPVTTKIINPEPTQPPPPTPVETEVPPPTPYETPEPTATEAPIPVPTDVPVP